MKILTKFMVYVKVSGGQPPVLCMNIDPDLTENILRYTIGGVCFLPSCQTTLLQYLGLFSSPEPKAHKVSL